jgi:hypothetical protein
VSGAVNTRLKILGVAMTLVLVAALGAIASHTTGAYFSDTKSGTMSGTLGSWGPSLTFSPGCSKAANPGACGEPPGVLIASRDTDGNLQLDFGGVYRGSCMAWSDVFRITSSAPVPLNVAFTASGAIAPLMASVTFTNDATEGELNPGTTRSVSVRLGVAPQVNPGIYSGTLVVAVAGSSESYSFPMVISVLPKGRHSRLKLPVTTSDYDGCWHNEPVTVHFSADDVDGLGVDYTEYSLDDGVDWIHGTSVTISGAGTTLVLYRSVDICGGVETGKRLSVKIDLTPPMTTSTFTPSGWTNCSVTLTLAATDTGGSGLKATYYKIGSGGQQTYAKPLTLTSAAAVTYWSVDNAGNIEHKQSFTPQVDTVAPITTATALPGGWTTGSLTLTLAATDTGGSGVKAIYYKIGGGGPQTYTTPITLASAAAITYWSVDNVGNTEKTHTFTPQIDLTAPSVTITAPVNGASYAQGAVVKASWTATDTLSGINAALTTSTPVANGKAIDTATAGTKTFTVTATDNAGNVTTRTVTYTVTPHS